MTLRTDVDLGHPLEPLRYPFDEVLLVHWMARGAGLEVHSCGVIDPAGRGWVFAGASGAGKSTLANILHEATDVTVLSDDRIVLREIDGEIRMYGTPWHGEAAHAAPLSASLAGIRFLVQDPEHELRPLPEVAAAARLFATSFPVFHSPEAVQATLDLAARIVTAVPCGELAFRRDAGVIDVLAGCLGFEPGPGCAT